MDSGSTVNGSLELIGEFRRRFPLLDRLVGRFGEDTPAEEHIPLFFGFILAAAEKPGSGACCIVLDKTPGTTAIAAVLAGLLRLQRDFPGLVESYARTALARGQHVKVRPGDFVYEYEGVWEDFPDFFRLKFLGEDASREVFRSSMCSDWNRRIAFAQRAPAHPTLVLLSAVPSIVFSISRPVGTTA